MTVSLSYPAHPAMREMMSALSGDVSFLVVGPTGMQPAGSQAAAGAYQWLYSPINHLRRHPLGAIAFQRARSRMLLTAAANSELIHCCSHLCYTGTPWIGDYENVNVLSFYSPRLLRSSRFVTHLRAVFEHASCRAIRVWSETAARSFRAVFPDDSIQRKLRVIYPAIACRSQRPSHKRAPEPRILFVGRGFWIKGGAIFLNAVRSLRRHLRFHVDFICDLPAECNGFREELEGTVSFHEPRFTRDELYERFYAAADIFVMLGMADSYGVSLLEASSFGLPIIAMRLNSGLSDLLTITGNAIQVEPEYQVFGSDGTHSWEPGELLAAIRNDVQARAVERVSGALSQLIGDPCLRRELGENGSRAVSTGRLSQATMREQLLNLYGEATS